MKKFIKLTPIRFNGAEAPIPGPAIFVNVDSILVIEDNRSAHPKCPWEQFSTIHLTRIVNNRDLCVLETKEEIINLINEC